MGWKGMYYISPLKPNVIIFTCLWIHHIVYFYVCYFIISTPMYYFWCKSSDKKCSPGKFLTMILPLLNDKKTFICILGFGICLHLSCKEINYDLCNWIIKYNDNCHCINLPTIITTYVHMTIEYVTQIVGCHLMVVIYKFHH